MKILKNYKKGISEATLRPKLVILLWFVNLLFSSFIYFQVAGLVTREVAPHIEADVLLKKMDFNVLFDLFIYHGEAIRMIIKTTIFIGVLYFFISFFLFGGILLSLRYPRKNKTEISEKPVMVPLFFHGAGKYFFRFFILWIYSLILWLIFILINIFLTPLGNLITRKGENEPMLLPIGIVRVLIAIFLVLLIKMIMDYARIKIVIENTRQVFRSLLAATGFIFKRFGKVLALFYLVFLSGLIFFIILWFVRSLVPTSSIMGVLVAFILGQMVIYSRCWTTTAFQAAQLDYYEKCI